MPQESNTVKQGQAGLYIIEFRSSYLSYVGCGLLLVPLLLQTPLQACYRCIDLSGQLHEPVCHP